MVEMPGVREPERVRKLLQGSANLEFWETYNSEEITPYLRQLDQTMANGGEVKKDTAATEKKDDAAEKAEVAEKTSPAKLKVNANKNSVAKAAASSESAQMAQAKKTNPLLAVLQLAPQGSLSVVGYANVRDTAAVNKIIYSAAAKQVLPSDLKLLWGAKPADGLSVKNVY